MGKSSREHQRVRYPALTSFLLERREDALIVAFSVIQDVLREPLPADALLPSWWDNDSGSEVRSGDLWDPQSEDRDGLRSSAFQGGEDVQERVDDRRAELRAGVRA